MPPLQAAAIAVLVALLAHCGQGWGEEIVIRNQMQEGKTMHVSCGPYVPYGPCGPEGCGRRFHPVAYLANITFTKYPYTTYMGPWSCMAYFASQSTGELPRFTGHYLRIDDLRCHKRCIIAAMPDAGYSMEVVAHYHNIQTDS